MIHSRLPTFTTQHGSVGAMATVVVLPFNDADVAAKDLIHIYATINKPVLLEILAEVTEIFNAGTTNVVTVGTEGDSGLDNIFAAGDIAEGAVGFSAWKVVRLEADTKIQAKYAQTGTAADTGSARFYIRATQLVSAD